MFFLVQEEHLAELFWITHLAPKGDATVDKTNNGPSRGKLVTERSILAARRFRRRRVEDLKIGITCELAALSAIRKEEGTGEGGHTTYRPRGRARPRGGKVSRPRPRQGHPAATTTKEAALAKRSQIT